jgi:macrolide transport system ATP-binding/permease protein
MTGFVQDLRYALRQLRENPGFACTSIFVLGLGVCASVSIFAFVDAALIKPLPYPNPGRLVEVTETAPMFPRGANLSYPDYVDWKKQSRVFSSLDVYGNFDYLLRTDSGAEPVTGLRVSDGLLRTLGIAPVVGRDFYPGEDQPQAARTAILSYAAWQKRFSGRREAIGKTVTLSGEPYTIIGVLPQDFQFAPAGNAEFWTALRATDPCSKRRSCHDLIGLGRLKAGTSVEMARANVTAIAAQLEAQYPADNKGQGAYVVPLSEMILSDVRPVLLVLLGGAGLLLLIACVNVSSLLLVRSESRRREIAVRGALGASRIRLIRQFTTEGIVLVLASTLLGVAGAQVVMQVLLALISHDMLATMPYLTGLGLNLHVLAFAGAVVLFSAILFSITPIFRLPLQQIRQNLNEGGRGYAGTLWRRFGANLVVVELAIAVVLLVGAGLLGKSFYRLLHVEIGFQPDHLATVYVSLSDVDYPTDEQHIAVEKKIENRVGALPGVESVGVTNILPVSYNGGTNWIRIIGRPYNGEHNEVNERHINPALFSTLRAKLLRGRYFTENDDASKPGVVIINRALAEKYFPGEDPIDKKIADFDLAPKSICEVVGVVDDVKDGALDSEIWPAAYYPFRQAPTEGFSLVVRTSRNEGALLPSIVTAVHEVNPGIGVEGEATMIGRMNQSPTAYLHRSSAWLVGGFAALALLLGVVGLYGVIAYSVSRRTREIGVRMALGAQRSSVYQLIMREAAWLTAVGIAGGLVCSVGVATLMRSLLFQTRSWDAGTLLTVAILLATSALVACYVPARRAAKVDPMEALRYE